MMTPLKNPYLKAAVLTTLLLCLFLFTILVLVPFFLLNLIVRSVVWALAKVLRPDLESFINEQASIFATERTDKATLNIMGTMLLKGNDDDVTVQSFQEFAQQRIIDYRDPETGELLYEKIKKTWEPFLGYAFWKTDRNFDLRNHVREYDYCGGKLELPNPCTEKDLARAIEGLLDEPWDRERSPWELLLVKNVIPDDGGEVCSAAFFRINHVLADGFSSLMILKKFFNVDFELPKFKISDRKFSPWEKFALCFKAPYDYLDATMSVLGSEKLQWTDYQWDEPLLVSLSSPVQVDMIKRIKNHFGVSYASVIYAGVIGAVERAALASGQVPPARIGTVIVLPKLGHPMKGMSVFATGVPVSFTLKAKSPIERLYKVQEELASLSRSTAFLFMPLLTDFFAYFPMRVQRAVADLFMGQGFTLGATVFPAAASIKCYGEYELTKLWSGVGSWAPLGLIVSTGGANNVQIFKFSINNSVFKSRTAARNLATYLIEEFRDLEEAIKKT